MKLFLLILLSVLLVCQEIVLFNKAKVIGEWEYKQSHRLYMALKSAYHYGYMDGKSGLPEDWDGPELSMYCSDCDLLKLCISNVTEQNIQAIANESGLIVTDLFHNNSFITMDVKDCK